MQCVCLQFKTKCFDYHTKCLRYFRFKEVCRSDSFIVELWTLCVFTSACSRQIQQLLCHVFAMSLPCLCHVFAMSLPCKAFKLDRCFYNDHPLDVTLQWSDINGCNDEADHQREENTRLFDRGCLQGPSKVWMAIFWLIKRWEINQIRHVNI